MRRGEGGRPNARDLKGRLPQSRSPHKCAKCCSNEADQGGDQSGIRREEGGRGSGNQMFVHQKWPKSIFPRVNFIFSHQICVPKGGYPRDALERKGPQRRPQERSDRRLEAAKAVGGGYCRLKMPMRLALGVRGTVAGHRRGGLGGGGGYPPPPPSNASLGYSPLLLRLSAVIIHRWR